MMRVGLTLSGGLLNDDGARLAAQLGATDVVVHLTNYSRNADQMMVFYMAAIDPDEPIPNGMVWNMRYRDGRTLTPPVRVSDAELRDRLTPFSAALRTRVRAS